MGRQNWFAAVGDEHNHVRNHAGVFDQTSFAKYEVKGRDAASALEYICANTVARDPGRLTYTQLLNSRGGIEADLTVSRITDNHFYIVTGTGFRTHDFAWIKEHLPKGPRGDVSITDVTENYATLSLMGPASRAILQAATKTDVSNTAFPFGRIKDIEIAGHKLAALRVTYVGELGWELHMPIAAAAAVYDHLMDVGKPQQLRPVGYRALESLRLEKAYRAWGSDITPNDTPFEAGLGWAVKLKSSTDFIGRAALEATSNKPLTKRLLGFTVDDPDAVLVGRETILRDGAFAGYLTSGGYGYTAGKSVGFGYVRNAEGVSDEFLASGNYELVIANETRRAKLEMVPLYDPTNARVKS
jgi:4-methylaminobutanoate oxidase (formaldehyde-forming)